MEGLLRLGKKAGEIYAGGAESWNVSKDGKTWTFKLRKNAKWSNGTPITSDDYLFGFKRALTPATGAQYANILYSIKNAKAFNKGKIKDFSKVGIKAQGKYCLVITLEKPVPYFEQLLTFAITYPVNKEFYEKHKENFALTTENLIYNGPFVLSRWIPNGEFDFSKNPYYWNAENIKIDRINCPMIEDYNTSANMYLNGELDVTTTSGNQLPMFRHKKDIKKIPDSVWFLQFNTKNKYFKNVNIRKAIALAINRKTFCKNIRKDGSIPAYSFVIPDINGGTADNEKISFRNKFNKPYFNENIKKAQALYAKGLKELALKKLPTIKFLTSNNDDSRRDGQFIQEQLHSHLGMDIQLDPNQFQSRVQKTNQMDFDMVYRNWLPDFNDPVNFLDIWCSNSRNSHTGWSNPEYDSLITKAGLTQNTNKRMQYLHKAEAILMNDFPVIPLFFRTNNWLVKPYVKDIVLRGFGVQASFIWARIEK